MVVEDSESVSNGSAHYRIGAVARITGVPAHTIRIWERRYQLLTPTRTPGGTRVYSEADVERLKAVHELVEQGHAISSVAHLSDSDLRQVLRRHHSPPEVSHLGAETLHHLREDFLRAVNALNLDEAEALLGRAVVALSPRLLVFGFIAPLMQEVGARWEAGTLRVAHEHAVSAMVRGQLARLAHRLGAVRGRAIACTPSGELHEFGALLASLVALFNGRGVTYLGPNLPAEEIAFAAVNGACEMVLLSCVSLEAQAARAEIETMRSLLPGHITILVGGRAAGGLGLDLPGVEVEQRLEGLEARLQRGR